MNVFKLVGMHADGLVEQGYPSCHAELCHLEHVGDGCGSYRRPDRSATTKCAAGDGSALSELCFNAAWRLRLDERAEARRAARRGLATFGLCGRGTLPAEA